MEVRMKVSELIAVLSKVEGDPEILVNGGDIRIVTGHPDRRQVNLVDEFDCFLREDEDGSPGFDFSGDCELLWISLRLLHGDASAAFSDLSKEALAKCVQGDNVESEVESEAWDNLRW
jgi:hypothetical protein